jgi:hypothetical protein
MPAARVGALTATGLQVEGGVDCSRIEAAGEVSFAGATIAGTLDITAGRVAVPGGRALTLSYATIGGKAECRELNVTGQVRAVRCHVAGEWSMSAARLDNAAGPALFAGGLRVGGGAFFRDGFRARGGVRLIGARLEANLSIEGATFENPGGVALDLQRAATGLVEGDGLTCTGQLLITGAQVGADLHLVRARLESGPGTVALDAERARIDGSLVLREATATGELNLRSIRVAERLLLMRATLSNPGETACRLTHAQVAGDALCGGVTVRGGLRLAGTVVGGTLALRGATLTSPAGVALDAEGLQARELIVALATVPDGEVNLGGAVLGVLRDDPATWPRRLHLDGLTYQVLDPLLPAGQRLRWLAREPGGYQPQPYEQLSAYYNALGQPAQGRDVLYARERLQRHGKGPAGTTWSILQDVMVGYGYRPRRALAWIGLLLVIGSVTFSVRPPAPLQAGAAPHFNGIVYSLDLMLPVVNLGQKYAFNPSGPEQWLSYFLIAAGWTLATTVAAGVARVLRRG